MRLSLAAAACAISVALLAGCSSSSPGGSALPNSGGVSQSYSHGGGGFTGKPEYPHGRMTPLGMMKWWAAGKMPGPASRGLLQKIVKYMEQRHQLEVKIRRPAPKTSVWVDNFEAYACSSPSDCGYGAIVGSTSKGGSVTGSVIYTGATGCIEGIGTKSIKGTLYATCGETDFNDNYSYTGGVATYNGTTGAPTAEYTGGCATNGNPGCEGSFYGFGYDVSANKNNVFVSDEYFEYYNGSEYVDSTGFQYWPNNGSSSTPTGTINAGGCQPSTSECDWYVYDVGYFDLDSSGNIWTYFYGCEEVSPYECGTGIGEVTNPTTSPTFSVAIAPGTIPGTSDGYWGGVYVYGDGKTLNVTNSYSRDTYQYDFPITPSSSPVNTLGPTPTNIDSCGEPIEGGFSKNDTDLDIADACGWLDAGVVSTNAWAGYGNINFLPSPSSASFVKADK
jgi:hypothetical protein